MPKVIDKVEEKINNSAFRLFGKNGYNNITMKMVAQDVGISVGTLYNYYSNKEDLFLNSFKQSFGQIYFALNNIIKKSKNPYKFISVLYNEIVRLKGFSRELIRSKINHEMVDELKNHLLILMRSLIYQAEEKGDLQIPDRDKDRVIRLLILAIYDFAQEFPDDKQGNIDFISRLIQKIK
jgi:AcrR family transcriptional regulator